MKKNTSTKTTTNRTTRIKFRDLLAKSALKTPSPIREYSGCLNWADIGDRALAFDKELTAASRELLTVAESLADLQVTQKAYPADLREKGRDIRAAVKRGFDALFVALHVAGFHDSIGDLEGILSPSPPPPTEDEIESM
jgi:hypothetical protein